MAAPAGGRLQPLGGRPQLHAPARADPAQPATRRADRIQLRRQVLPVPQDPPPDRALGAADHALARPDRQALARRHEVPAGDHRAGADRAHLHVHGPQSRTAVGRYALQGARREGQGPAMLRRALLLAIAAALLAPGAASAGTLSISGRTIVYNDAGGTNEAIAGYRAGNFLRVTK